jgi:hypothetical protein
LGAKPFDEETSTVPAPDSCLRKFRSVFSKNAVRIIPAFAEVISAGYLLNFSALAGFNNAAMYASDDRNTAAPMPGEKEEFGCRRVRCRIKIPPP